VRGSLSSSAFGVVLLLSSLYPKPTGSKCDSFVKTLVGPWLLLRLSWNSWTLDCLGSSRLQDHSALLLPNYLSRSADPCRHDLLYVHFLDTHKILAGSRTRSAGTTSLLRLRMRNRAKGDDTLLSGEHFTPVPPFLRYIVNAPFYT
jgi:hypothetical protein